MWSTTAAAIDFCLDRVCGEGGTSSALLASVNHVARSRAAVTFTVHLESTRPSSFCLQQPPPPPAVAAMSRAKARLAAFETEDDRLANTLEMGRDGGCILQRWGTLRVYRGGVPSDPLAVARAAASGTRVRASWQVVDGERHLRILGTDVVVRFKASHPLSLQTVLPPTMLDAFPDAAVEHRRACLALEAGIFRAGAEVATSKPAFDACRDAEARLLREVGYLEDELQARARGYSF